MIILWDYDSIIDSLNTVIEVSDTGESLLTKKWITKHHLKQSIFHCEHTDIVNIRKVAKNILESRTYVLSDEGLWIVKHAMEVCNRILNLEKDSSSA